MRSLLATAALVAATASPGLGQESPKVNEVVHKRTMEGTKFRVMHHVVLTDWRHAADATVDKLSPSELKISGTGNGYKLHGYEIKGPFSIHIAQKADDPTKMSYTLSLGEDLKVQGEAPWRRDGHKLVLSDPKDPKREVILAPFSALFGPDGLEVLVVLNKEVPLHPAILVHLDISK